MSKKEDPPIRATLEFPKRERGLSLEVGSWSGFLIGGGLLLAGGIWIWIQLHKYSRPTNIRTEPEPWPGWAVLGWLALLLGIIIAVGLLAYIARRAWLSLSQREAEVTEAHVRARTVAADKGVLPVMLSRDLNNAVNLNAAPSGHVEGLNSRPVMPEATAAQAEATARASFIQIAAAADHAAAVALALLGRRPVTTGAEMPPLWADDQPADVGRLLDAAESEYRLLDVVESGNDDLPNFTG